MASVEEGSVYNDPNFGVIWSFIEKFGELCGLSPELTITGLQLMLEDTRNVHQDLIDLHIRLLRRSGKKNVPPDKWEKALVKFCHSYSKVDAWEIERFGYKKSKLTVKLILLKRLLESQFDGNSKFKTEVNKLTADELRLLPIGRDLRGKMYWYHQDRDLNLRIYREDQDDETWEVIVKERDELVALISNLENHTSPKKDDVSTTPSDTGESKDGEISLSNSLDAKGPSECLQFPIQGSVKLEDGEDKIFLKPEPVNNNSSLKLTCVKREDISFKIEEETVCCQEDLKEIKPDIQLTIKTEPVDEDIKEENLEDSKNIPLKSFSNALCHISPNFIDASDKGTPTEVVNDASEKQTCEVKDKSENGVAQGTPGKVRESVIKLAEKLHAVDETPCGSSLLSATSLPITTQVLPSETQIQDEATDLSVKKDETPKSLVKQPKAVEDIAVHDDPAVPSTKPNKELESELSTCQKTFVENTEHAIERKRMPLKKREIPKDYDADAASSNVDVCDGGQQPALLPCLTTKDSLLESVPLSTTACVKSEPIEKDTSVTVKEESKSDVTTPVVSSSVAELANVETTSVNLESDREVTKSESVELSGNLEKETGESGVDSAPDNDAKSKQENERGIQVDKNIVDPDIVRTSESNAEEPTPKCSNDVVDESLPSAVVNVSSRVETPAVADASGVDVERQTDSMPTDKTSDDLGGDPSTNCVDRLRVETNVVENQPEQCGQEKPISSDKIKLNTPESELATTVESDLLTVDAKPPTVEAHELDSGDNVAGNADDVPKDPNNVSEVSEVPIDQSLNLAGDKSSSEDNSVTLTVENSEIKSVITDEPVPMDCDVTPVVESGACDPAAEGGQNGINNEHGASAEESAECAARVSPPNEGSEVEKAGVEKEAQSASVLAQDNLAEPSKSSGATGSIDNDQVHLANEKEGKETDSAQPAIEARETTVNVSEPNIPEISSKPEEAKCSAVEADEPAQTVVQSPAPKKRKRGNRELSELGPIENLPVKRSPRLQAQRLKYEDEKRKIETELQRQALLIQQRLNEERKQKRSAKNQCEGSGEASAVANGKVTKKRGRPKKKVEEKEKPANVLSKKKRVRKRRSKQNKKKKKSVVVQRRKKKTANPWDVSSESSYCSSSEAGGKAIEEEDEDEEEEEEDEELLFNDKSDHEFSPESEPEDSNYQPATIKRARTVKKEKTEIESDESSSEGDDKPCSKCSKQDHPEWILLCDKCDSGYHTSCLRPPLMVIPDGDWFCPPCCHVMLLEKLHEQLKNFDQLWKKKDREEMRKKRLAYVGISLDNVLKPEKEHKESCEEEESEEDVVEEVKEYVFLRKRSRRTRKEVSYRFKEFDELIKSAIDPEPSRVPPIKGPTGLGKGKDMSNISCAEDVGEDLKGKAEEEEEKEKEELADNDENEMTDYHSTKKRKHRRLNDLDTSSEDQDDDSDEDFQGSSSNSDPSEEDSYGAAEDSDESWDESRSGRFRSKSSRYDQDFVVDNSDDSFDSGRRKGRRAAAKTVNYREVSESDDDYGTSRKKSRNFLRPFREPRESDNDSDWKKPSKRSRFDFASKPSKRPGKMWRLESDDDEDDSDNDKEEDDDDDVKPTTKKYRGRAHSNKHESRKVPQGKSKKRMNMKDFVKKSDEDSTPEEDSENESNDEEDKEDESDSEGSKCEKVIEKSSAKKRELEINDKPKVSNEEANVGVLITPSRSPPQVASDVKSTTPIEDKTVSMERADVDKHEQEISSEVSVVKDTNEIKLENTETESVGECVSDKCTKNSDSTASKDDDKVAASGKSTSELPPDGSKNLSDVDAEVASKPKLEDTFPERGKPNSSELLERLTPLHPSVVEPYPIRSSPSKLTLLDNYSQRSSPQNKLTPLELYPPSPSTGVIPPFDRDRPSRPHGAPLPHPPPIHSHQYHGEYGNYPGQYYPPYPPHSSQYSSSPPMVGYQSPSGSYPPYQQPSPNYGYVPQAYNEQGLYQGQPPHYGPPYPNYSPPPPPHVAAPQSSTSSQGQSNGRFSIDNLLQRRMEGSEDDEFSSVNEFTKGCQSRL